MLVVKTLTDKIPTHLSPLPLIVAEPIRQALLGSNRRLEQSLSFMMVRQLKLSVQFMMRYTLKHPDQYVPKPREVKQKTVRLNDSVNPLLAGLIRADGGLVKQLNEDPEFNYRWEAGLAEAEYPFDNMIHLMSSSSENLSREFKYKSEQDAGKKYYLITESEKFICRAYVVQEAVESDDQEIVRICDAEATPAQVLKIKAHAVVSATAVSVSISGASGSDDGIDSDEEDTYFIDKYSDKWRKVIGDADPWTLALEAKKEEVVIAVQEPASNTGRSMSQSRSIYHTSSKEGGSNLHTLTKSPSDPAHWGTISRKERTLLSAINVACDVMVFAHAPTSSFISEDGEYDEFKRSVINPGEDERMDVILSSGQHIILQGSDEVYAFMAVMLEVAELKVPLHPLWEDKGDALSS